MKVLYQNDDRFIVDPEDGKKEMIVVSYDGNRDELRVFPRTNTLDSILRFGVWEKPIPDIADEIISELKGKKFPVQNRTEQ